MKTLVAAVIAAVATTCHADSVRWYVDGITFDDGATAHGWFDKDATTGAFGRFVIYTTDGPHISGHEYRDGDASLNQYGSQLTFGRTDTWELRLVPVSPLTAAGGTMPLDFSNQEYNLECSNCGAYRFITAGQLIGVTDVLFGNGFDD